MDILQKITASKRKEVELRKQLFSVKSLESSPFFFTKRPSFVDALRNPGPAIIAEFKRRSPSKGIINGMADPGTVANGYEKAGARAISILTDKEYFGGGNSDLQRVADFSGVPLLRKDFIIDSFQVIESKSIGASAILLIASILSKAEVRHLSEIAVGLGLDILFEVHDPEDLGKMNENISIIGVNNRNLNTFETDINQSMRLFSRLPEDSIKVAESGINSADDVIDLYRKGYDAFLIGELFMRSPDPGLAAMEFISKLSQER